MVKIFIKAQKTTLCTRQNTSVLLTNKKSAKISLKVKHFNKKRRISNGCALCKFTVCQNMEQATVTPAITMATMLISFIKIFKDGPEVSLNGSPTVSPITAALWASEPLPP